MTGTRTASAATIERRHGRVSVSAGDSGGRASRDRARPRPVANNLPLSLDALVGRDEALAAIGELLAEHRIVTITGAPGMGKTRLSIEVARSAFATGSHSNGVWLVALAPLGEPDLVGPAVASVLSVPGNSKRGGYDNLIARIADQRLLLVLDNCEHVLDACAQLAAALLEACPHLAILATSQERLSVPGEQVWQLSGLAVPVPDSDEPASETRASEPVSGAGSGKTGAAASPAVQLFARRARASSRRFTLTADNLAPVIDICRRLDGIPLAIELAAARVGPFSPAEIARHLDDRFAFLTGGSRAALPRHQTLKAAVDWSYDLLSEPEQTLLRRLSVFAGGATLDAIEQVCTGLDIGADQCVELMNTLVARSLVVAEDGLAETRYRLLETIRFYGRDRLAEAGEVTALAARHVRWCVSLAEAAEPELTTATQQEWVTRLEVDHDNLRAAMTWSLDQGPPEDALRLAGALTMFWRIRGYFREGFGRLDQALIAGSALAPQQVAKATWGRALMAAMMAEYQIAVPEARAALALYETLDDAEGRARSLLLIGSFNSGDADERLGGLQQAIALARQVGDSWCLALALAICGATFDQAGDSDTARAVLAEAVDVARASGDEQSLCFALVSLGQIELHRGELASAESVLLECLAFAGAGGSDYESIFARLSLAEIAQIRGDHARARFLLGEVEQGPHQVYADQTTLEWVFAQGQLALAEGQVDAADAHFTATLSYSQASGATSIGALLGQAEVALARGETERARSLLPDALAEAKATSHESRALYLLGNLTRAEGDDARAVPIHLQALALRLQAHDMPGAAASLEAMAGLAARGGQVDKAARVFGAAKALREAHGYARPTLSAATYEADLALARDSLGDEFDTAFARGATMSPDAALSYLSKGRGTRGKRPVSGLASLTKTERTMAEMAAQGVSNAEIADQLFVSTNTVKTHLSSVFAKLSLTSRRELKSYFPHEPL